MKLLKLGTFAVALLSSVSAQAASVYVRDIKVEGLQRVEPETVLSYVNVKKNALTDDSKLDASLKQLYSTGLFNDVSLNVRPDGMLVIKVEENPVINKVLFDGNDKVDDDMVEPQIIKRDQNRVDLIFKIDEGPLAVIDKINFIGNHRYDHDDLQEVIMSKESRWYRIFSSSENYDAEKTNYDKELLRRFYLKRGYADFRRYSGRYINVE